MSALWTPLRGINISARNEAVYSTTLPLISLREHELGEELHGKGGGGEDARAHRSHAVMNNFSE